MREEVNWFERWEEELPAPAELMPLSQTLITRDLALAFDIIPPGGDPLQPLPPSSALPPPGPQDRRGDHDSPETGGAGGVEDPATRTVKRPRLVWTPQLHKRFVEAVAHLGIKNAVPKTIMQFMNVDGLTRENVASHLQKYRLYLKRMQSISSSSAAAVAASVGGGVLDQFIPFVPPPPALQQQQQAQFFHHRHIVHMGSPPSGGFELGFQRMVAPPPEAAGFFPNDPDSSGDAAEIGRRNVLTLFPTSDD
ncbi:unnamed protein product [Spirodela intermedia]|uniref:HTH myb-type domain-containing protein n=1 Tax=Spirodela intermedia TaxID=51605 RepID=A0A7I8KKM9_SPIIN|nr:unnamed protein product [Spirodela intermedia]